MATWDITVNGAQAQRSGDTGATSSLTAPGDFDGSTITDVSVVGTPTIDSEIPNPFSPTGTDDTIGVRFWIQTSTATDIYGSSSAPICSGELGEDVTSASITDDASPSPAPTTAVAADWDRVFYEIYYNSNMKNDNETCRYSGVAAGDFDIRVTYTPAAAEEDIAAIISNSGSVIADTTGEGSLAAQIDTILSSTQPVEGAGSVASLIDLATTVAADTSGSGVLAAQINALLTQLADTTATGGLGGLVSLLSTVTVDIQDTPGNDVEAVILNSLSQNADITSIGTLAAIVLNSLTQNADVSGAGGLASVIANVVSVIADTTGAGSLASVVSNALSVLADTTATGGIASQVDGAASVLADTTDGGPAAGALYFPVDQPWTEKPPPGTEIDFSNPFVQDMIFFCKLDEDGDQTNLITEQKGPNASNGTSTVGKAVTRYGHVQRFNMGGDTDENGFLFPDTDAWDLSTGEVTVVSRWRDTGTYNTGWSRIVSRRTQAGGDDELGMMMQANTQFYIRVGAIQMNVVNLSGRDIAPRSWM